MNGQEVVSKKYKGNQGSQICGGQNSGWNELADILSGSINLGDATTVEVMVNSNLDQDSNDESFGVRGVRITYSGCGGKSFEFFLI